SVAQPDIAYPPVTRSDQGLKWCDTGHKNRRSRDTRRLRVAILIRVSENEAYLSVESQTGRQLRLHPTRKPPQESLTVGRILLREPIEIDRIAETGCRAKGMGPQNC